MRDGLMRRGFLARCEMDGAEGWGDIAPLDGYSRETFGEVARAIHAGESSSLASIRCGLEFAEAECRAKLAGKRFVEYLGGGAKRVEVATLSDGVENRTPKGGIIKLKVARRTSGEVTRIMAEHPEARFRLDANRAWGLDEALTFCRALDPARVEFMEEPLCDFSNYDAFNNATPVSFALDESLLEQSPRAWENLKALVIKPSLLGGLKKSIGLIDWAHGAGKYAVVSSMYESGVGIHHLAALAAAKTPDVPAGLDTYSRLLDDVVSPRLDMSEGFLATDVSFTIDMKKLELVR